LKIVRAIENVEMRGGSTLAARHCRNLFPEAPQRSRTQFAPSPGQSRPALPIDVTIRANEHGAILIYAIN